MAIDEWLAWRASLEPGGVYLRLYTWRVGAITIGLHQKKELALDFSRLSDTPVIRRVTGGRAVYHDPSELTYAIAVNTRHLRNPQLVGSLSKTSAAIAEALTRFLTRLGIESRCVRRSSATDSRTTFFHTAPCFDSASRHEVVTDSRKIIASAQRRIKATILQHGAIKLGGIAPHPALGGQPRRNFCAFDAAPIAKDRFDLMASLFAQEMGAFFGLLLEERQLGDEDWEKVAYRTATLKKNPLAGRNSFEQPPPVNSLSSEI
jgi:hypothetical protein